MLITIIIIIHIIIIYTNQIKIILIQTKIIINKFQNLNIILYLKDKKSEKIKQIQKIQLHQQQILIKRFHIKTQILYPKYINQKKI